LADEVLELPVEDDVLEDFPNRVNAARAATMSITSTDTAISPVLLFFELTGERGVILFHPSTRRWGAWSAALPRVVPAGECA
jgi:hypothetical protein